MKRFAIALCFCGFGLGLALTACQHKSADTLATELAPEPSSNKPSSAEPHTPRLKATAPSPTSSSEPTKPNVRARAAPPSTAPSASAASSTAPATPKAKAPHRPRQFGDRYGEGTIPPGETLPVRH